MPAPDLVCLPRSEQTPFDAAGSKNRGIGFQSIEPLRIVRLENASCCFLRHVLSFPLRTRHGVPPSHRGFMDWLTFRVPDTVVPDRRIGRAQQETLRAWRPPHDEMVVRPPTRW